MTEKLKPCPFCGGMPEVLRATQKRRTVACTACFVETRPFLTEAAAIAAWNRRAGDSDDQ